MAERRAYVGQEILRREDDYLLRGQGRFVDDIACPGDTIHLGFVMSPHAHARIRSIDAAAARRLDGVIAVLTGERDTPNKPQSRFSLIASLGSSRQVRIASRKPR